MSFELNRCAVARHRAPCQVPAQRGAKLLRQTGSGLSPIDQSNLNQEPSHDTSTKTHDRRYATAQFLAADAEKLSASHRWTGPLFSDQPGALELEDIRQYQVYLANDCRYSAQSVNQFVSAVKFLYEITLEAPFDRAALLRARVPNKAPSFSASRRWPTSSTTSPASATAPRSW